MSIELVEALLIIIKFCLAYEDCLTCPLKKFCGKIPTEW